MTRYATCIFCDDIRMEVGNKISLIGVYGGVLQVPSIPALLPKLCIQTNFETPADQAMKSFTLRISYGEKLLSENKLGEDDLTAAMDHVNRDSNSLVEPFTVFSLMLQNIMSPFEIKEPGTLKVIVIVDGVEYPGGKLRIQKEPSAQ